MRNVLLVFVLGAVQLGLYLPGRPCTRRTRMQACVSRRLRQARISALASVRMKLLIPLVG